jgi:type IV secretory pathway VirB2 component (pilin)
MRTFILMARRSAAPVGGLVIAVLVWAMALSATTPGLRLWPDLVTGLSAASIYTGTVAAGFAAFEAGRWKVANASRTRYGVRSPGTGRLLHAAAVMAPLVAGYLLSLLALSVYAAAAGYYGEPSLVWLAAVGATLIVASSLGYVIGSAVGMYWFVPPAAALAFYAMYVIAWSLRLPFGVQSLFPYVTNTDSNFVRYVNATMVGQVALWMALAVVFVVAAGWGWRRGAQKFAIAFSVFALMVAALGASTILATHGQYTIGHNSRDFTCRGGSLILCMNPGYAVAIPGLYRQFAQLNSRAAGTHLVAGRLEQNVEGVGDDPSKGSRSVYLEQLGGGSDLEFSAYRYLAKYGATPACEGRGASSISASTVAAINDVDAWLSGYFAAADGSIGTNHLARLRSLSPKSGNGWFRAHAEAYFSCTLTLADMP